MFLILLAIVLFGCLPVDNTDNQVNVVIEDTIKKKEANRKELAGDKLHINSNEDKTNSNDSLLSCKKILELPLSENDSTKIGYIQEEFIDGTFGPTSMFVQDDFIYLIDRYFGKIRRIDKSSGKIYSSMYNFKISQPWLQDITIFQELVVVTSELGTVYFFDKKLNFLHATKTDSDDIYILGENKDYLNIYLNNSGRILNVDIEGNIIGETENRINIWQKKYHLFDFNELGNKYNLLTKKKILNTIPLIRTYNSKNYFLIENLLYYFTIVDGNISFFQCKIE